MKELINRESNRLGEITKGDCPGAICEQYPMASRPTVYRWIKAFVQKHQTDFKSRQASPIKQECLAEILQLYRLGLNYEAIHRSVPKVSVTTIRRWIMSSEQRPCTVDMRMKKKTESKPLDTELKAEELMLMNKEQLIGYCRRMQARLREQNARVLLAETMIDVAEEQFGIAIRKT